MWLHSSLVNSFVHANRSKSENPKIISSGGNVKFIQHGVWYSPVHSTRHSHQIQNTIKRTEKFPMLILCTICNVHKHIPVKLNEYHVFFLLLSMIAYKFIVLDIYVFQSVYENCGSVCIFLNQKKKFAHDLTYNKHKRKTNNVYIWVVIIVSISVSESFALVMNDKPQFISR